MEATMSAEGFFAGCVGGCAGILVGHPLDTVKVRIQAQPVHRSYKGILYCLKNLVRSEGCMTGALQTFLSCPIDFVKIQLQLQAIGIRKKKVHKEMLGPLGVLSCIYKKHGITGCFRGFTITLIRDCPGYGVYFGSNYYFCELFKQNDGSSASPMSLLIAGGLAGTISWAVCYPVDVLKTLIQADGHLPHNERKSMMYYAKNLYIQGGFSAFTRGINTTLLRAFPVNAIVFFTVSLITKKLNANATSLT
ncbi:mitochondrial basic amino acids transporter-like isoform X2 [Hydra vulgaris]|uniref:Mitochondrial basic amino acids transporter-like isoform X2 n=1 Tax=Hydra vulgaris TaxID=6087 RepID=A0ABM4CFP7_HYDVU